MAETPICIELHQKADLARLSGTYRTYTRDYQEGIEMQVAWESPSEFCYECPICKKQERVAK